MKQRFPLAHLSHARSSIQRPALDQAFKASDLEIRRRPIKGERQDETPRGIDLVPVKLLPPAGFSEGRETRRLAS